VALGLQLNSWFGFQRALAILGEQATLSGAGTTQGTATQITTANAVFATVAVGTGGVLPVSPAVSANYRIHVANNGVNTLAIYPPSGGKLGSASVNVPALIAPGKCADFYCVDGTNYTALLSA
jgi:hypothetical protein